MGSPGLPQDLAEQLEKAALQPGQWRGGQECGAASGEVPDTSSSLKGDLAIADGEKWCSIIALDPGNSEL